MVRLDDVDDGLHDRWWREELTVVLRALHRKLHQEVLRKPISELITHFEKKPPKGEFVLLFNLFGQNSPDLIQSEKEE